MTERHIEPPPWREVFQGPRGRLVTGLLLLEALVAVYALVITAIMPAVRDDLGGTNVYGFAFAVWGLGTIVTIPIAGHAADRFGPRSPLLVVLGVQFLGFAVSGLAPNMGVLIFGFFLLGSAGGAMYAVSLGTVSKTFPQRIRARIMALLATMWILPGLVGPPLGAFIATTIGWRWAFVVPIPMMLLAVSLVLPVLRTIPPGTESGRMPIRWSFQVAGGLALLLGGLTSANVWSIPLALAGVGIGLPALLHIVPPGTLRGRPGMPAAAASMFLLSGAFFTVDTFIPLMLTSIHGFTYGEASIVITVATVTWSIGSWWQSRVAGSVNPGVLVRIGTTFVLVGIAGVASGLIAGLPTLLVYVGWTSAGAGMGIAFPTIPLAVMGASEEGKEAGQLSATLLMDTLGMTIGSGLGGAAIAFATAANGNAGLRAGIAGAYAVGLAMLLLLFAITPRISPRED